jgi:hypothetical protein
MLKDAQALVQSEPIYLVEVRMNGHWIPNEHHGFQHTRREAESVRAEFFYPNTSRVAEYARVEKRPAKTKKRKTGRAR